jgi:hypothetical protein
MGSRTRLSGSMISDDEQAARDALTAFIAELRKKGRLFPAK